MTMARWLFACCFLLALSASSVARANMGSPFDVGQAHGPLMLRRVSEVRVDSEELRFELSRSLSEAQVSATYHLTNVTDAPTELDLAFVRVHGSEDVDPRGKDVHLTVDGRDVPFRVLTEAEGRPAWAEQPRDAKVTWLTFDVPFAARASRTVRVSYKHIAGADRQVGVNEVYGYDYLLSPAKSWASFGPIEVSIGVPDSVALRSNTAFRREGERYVARLAGPPRGELHFTVMSLSKVRFGIEDPRIYWLMLVLVTSLLVLGSAELAGRAWSRASFRFGRGLLHAFVSSSLGAAISVGMWILAAKWLPTYGLGPNYSPIFGGFFMTVAMAFAAIGLSIRASHAAQRRRPRPA